MNYYFISDDTFFLYGIQDVIKSRDITCSFIHPGDDNTIFYPQPGDLVVLAVNDNSLRTHLLKTPGIMAARLVIMADIPGIRTERQVFPCLMSKGVTVKGFLRLLERAANIPVSQGTVSRQVMTIFNQLSHGDTVHGLSAYSRLSLKYIYRVKRNVFQEYGLTGCNSVGILLCRDMLRMKMPV
ncbi:hypothetical protein [Entomohabitans teleogrylli]|uniref:hypothetical protein n=1 Tax=Entomohabitans teleogrylli TaxID=1384589 RepID=UPI00073D5A91|nr:hypothetical protein [Entomohabitans teleogrylli]